MCLATNCDHYACDDQTGCQRHRRGGIDDKNKPDMAPTAGLDKLPSQPPELKSAVHITKFAVLSRILRRLTRQVSEYVHLTLNPTLKTVLTLLSKILKVHPTLNVLECSVLWDKLAVFFEVEQARGVGVRLLEDRRRVAGGNRGGELMDGTIEKNKGNNGPSKYPKAGLDTSFAYSPSVFDLRQWNCTHLHYLSPSILSASRFHLSSISGLQLLRTSEIGRVSKTHNSVYTPFTFFASSHLLQPHCMLCPHMYVPFSSRPSHRAPTSDPRSCASNREWCRAFRTHLIATRTAAGSWLHGLGCATGKAVVYRFTVASPPPPLAPCI